MSTDYRPIPAIPFIMLFDGCLEKHGVREGTGRGREPRRRCLIGRDGVLDAYEEDDRTSSFTRRSFTPVPWAVIDAIEEEFGVELVTEHDHRYWGFANEEEEREFHERIAKEYADELYKDIVLHLRGEPNGLKAGTIGMVKAEIAKALIASDPSLLDPNNRQQLLEAVEAIYDRDHTINVTLTPEDIAAVELMVSRTNKLPQA